jgi:hypothetical protein
VQQCFHLQHGNLQERVQALWELADSLADQARAVAGLLEVDGGCFSLQPVVVEPLEAAQRVEHAHVATDAHHASVVRALAGQDGGAAWAAQRKVGCRDAEGGGKNQACWQGHLNRRLGKPVVHM